MVKAFNLWLWQNSPSVNTPLGESKLNLINRALDEVDSRVVNFDTTKANQTDMLTTITNVTLDESTGIFTFTRKNGTTIKLDTKLEKLILNWNYDKSKQILYLILSDGSQMPIDLSSLISQYEFVDSTTIRWVIGNDGKVAAEIIRGTITADMLEPNYLANVELYASQALESANNAKTSEENSKASEQKALGYAEEAKQYASQTEGLIDEVNKKLELATFELDNDGNLIYTDTSSYEFLVDDDGMLNYSVV